MRAAMHARQAGFTLLEAVLVIVLTGVVAAMVAVFIRAPITAYVDQARRGELTDAADTALRRLSRELQRALPNPLLSKRRGIATTASTPTSISTMTSSASVNPRCRPGRLRSISERT